jgi:ABC-type Na+ efflux pump permease subunit
MGLPSSALLSNPVSRLDIALGKSLAVVVFSTAGLLLCLLAFRFVYTPAGGGLMLVLLTGMLPLALLAAALKVGFSTLCSSVKEAHTYLSMFVFVPMAMGMVGVFSPGLRLSARSCLLSGSRRTSSAGSVDSQ